MNSTPQRTSKWFVFQTPISEFVACFRIRPANDSDYLDALENLRYSQSDLTAEDFNERASLIVATHLIHDWMNICFDEDGVTREVDYSPENAQKLILTGDLGLEILKSLNATSSGMVTETVEVA